MSLSEVLYCLLPPPPKAMLHITVRARPFSVPYPQYLYVFIDDLYYAMYKKAYEYRCPGYECEVEISFCIELHRPRRVLVRSGYRIGETHVPVAEVTPIDAYTIPPANTRIVGNIVEVSL